MQFLEDAPVIVIGAGLAGLTAAWKLKRSGREPVVLEADDRIGGRLHSSARWDAGQRAELGAELIDVAYHALAQLCSDVGVALLEGRTHAELLDDDESLLEGYLRTGQILVSGRALDDAQKAACSGELRSAIRDHRPHDGEIVEQWIRRAKLSESSASVVRSLGRMLTHLEPWDCDAHALLSGRSGVYQRLDGGTRALTTALASGLDVRVGDPVVRVQRGRTVQVTTASGQRVGGSDVICAVGPYAVSAIGFDPPLSDERVTTATSLLPAMGGTVVAQYAEGDRVRAALGPWVCTDEAISAAWVAPSNHPGAPAVVTSYVGGTDRNLLNDEAAAIARLDELVERLLGSPATRLHADLKNWWADPLHFAATVAPAAGMRAAVAGILGGEELVAHFAGDYTDARAAGTLEGAVVSGLRAANEVLRASPSYLTDYVTGRLSTS